MRGILYLPFLLIIAAGCATTESAPADKKVENGVTWVSQALPTGKSSTSAILVERGTPERVPVGKPYDYEIRVTNLANHDLSDVTVDEQLGDGITLNRAEPAPASAEGHALRFDLGTLPKGQVVTIKVNATPTLSGQLSSRCEVRYRALVGGALTVVEPKLSIESTVPAMSLVDEPVGVKFTVTNPGTGDTNGVVIDGQLPEGLRTLDGQSAVHIDVGALPAGATREYVVSVKGSATGAYAVKAVATSGDGLTADTGPVQIAVRRARIEVEALAPADGLLAREFTVNLKVRNTGDGDARNARLEVTLPEGVKYVGATEGVQVEGSIVRFNLGTLAAGQEQTLDLKVSSSKTGDAEIQAKASADFTEGAAASAKTRFEGIAALSLEVLDNEDPIAIGGEVTYTITVKNQGTAPDRNVHIECEVEDGMALVNAEGATKREGSGEGAKKFSFASLDTLLPGQSATWWVKVKAEKAGDLRFRAGVTSGQISRPVEESESTLCR